MGWAIILKRDKPLPLPAPPAADSGECRRKRPRKPAPVSHLYPTPQATPLRHARATLKELQEHAEEACGTYVPQKELARFYVELCERGGWTPRHWTAIARHMIKLTNRRRLKHDGRQFFAYKIPRT